MKKKQNHKGECFSHFFRCYPILLLISHGFPEILPYRTNNHYVKEPNFYEDFAMISAARLLSKCCLSPRFQLFKKPMTATITAAVAPPSHRMLKNHYL